MKLLKNLFGIRPKNQPEPPKSIESLLMIEDRDLYFVLSKAPKDKQRRVAAAVARHATGRVDLQNPILRDALSRLERNEDITPEMISAVSRLVDDLDLKNDRLQIENDDKPVKHPSVPFVQARAASSVAAALSGKVDEAVYEAIHASQDLPKIRQITLTILKEGIRPV
ncbi:MAG TPA: hypothetical protein VFV23_13425 [Verrucomicrobiae bacterium]|nr:hypothetical protein [Verrucomicrobiae bacterium]